MPANVGKII
jgi:hypothetical protein